MINFRLLAYKTKNLILLHKNIFFGSTILLFLFCIATFFYFFFKQKNIILGNKPLSSYSSVKFENGNSYFSINSETGYLYKSQRTDIEAVKDFLNQKPTYTTQKDIFPKNIAKNTLVVKRTKSLGLNGTKEHYFLTQTLDGIPIYESSLLVHVKNNNEIYGISGNLTLNETKGIQHITDDKAEQIALKIAQTETSSNLVIRNPKKYFFNKRINDMSDDSTNHPSLAVYVDSAIRPLSYSTFFIISLENGELLFKENQFHDVLNRTINNCAGLDCNIVRQEGGPVTGIADADSVYNIFSDVYSYYLNTFTRDSYDGAGGPYVGFVNHDDPSTPNDCPNAAWNGQEMIFCPDMVARDVTWHELTHALTQYTAGLKYQRQAGALNESMSDIFGSASDNNWTIGEGSKIGIIRSMSNPEKSPRRPQPDKVFSSNYYCVGLTSRCDGNPGGNDSCGVHINSGVINKTFFLMTDGGSFNGCTINGVGRQKAHAIIYSALTNYLTQTSNFYDMYSAIQQACGDRYGSTSVECIEVKKATQATELDQQPVGTQSGPFCTGGVEKPATCAGAPTTVPPTEGPTATPTSTPTPTLRPGETPTLTPTLTQSPQPTPTPTPIGGGYQQHGTPTPTPDQYFTCKPDPNCIKSGKKIQLCPLICTPE